MSLTRRQFLLSTSAVALTSAVARPALAQIGRSATPMRRAEELLRQMTIEEKAMQLSAAYPIGMVGPDGYTTFDYGPLKLERDTVDVSGEARVSLTVTNAGKRRGSCTPPTRPPA